MKVLQLSDEEHNTLSLMRALAPTLRSNAVVATSPASAEKKRADHPVLCDDGERQGICYVSSITPSFRKTLK